MFYRRNRWNISMGLLINVILMVDVMKYQVSHNISQGRMQTLEMRGAQQGIVGAAPRKFFQGSAVPNAGVDPSIHFINDFYSILAEKNLY